MVLVALVFTMSLTLAACGSDSDSGTSTGSGDSTQASADSGAAAPKPPEVMPGAGIDLVPKDLQKYFGGYNVSLQDQKLGPSPYASWTPPKPPWKFCFNNNFLGNQNRQDYLTTMQAEVKALQAKGLASGPLVSTNSNLNTPLQISQFNNAIQSGCDVIFYISPDATSLCKVSQAATEKGILAIGMEQPVPCKDGFAVQANDYQYTYDTAGWMAEGLKGKGNVVLEPGITSSPANSARMQAANDVFAQYPDIDIIGEVATNWDPATAKTKITQFLATHPQKIDGMFSNGCCGDLTSAQALKQAGRPDALINGSGDGTCSWLAYWRDNKLSSFSPATAGQAEMVWNWEVALRMLNGQKAKINNVLHPVPYITDDTLDEWTKPDWTDKSTCSAYPYDTRGVRKEYLDQLFEGGKPVDAELLAPVWSKDAVGALDVDWTLDQ